MTERPPPDIETPVIDIEDLEHQPGPDTRVNESGMRAEPRPLTKEEIENALADVPAG